MVFTVLNTVELYLLRSWVLSNMKKAPDLLVPLDSVIILCHKHSFFLYNTDGVSVL